MPLLKHGLKCFTNIYEGNLCVLTFLWDSLLTPLLKMMKFTCREVKRCAPGYAMSQWPSRKLKPEVLAPQTRPGCVTTTQLIAQSLTQPTSCCASSVPGVPRECKCSKTAAACMSGEEQQAPWHSAHREPALPWCPVPCWAPCSRLWRWPNLWLLWGGEWRAGRNALLCCRAPTCKTHALQLARRVPPPACTMQGCRLHPLLAWLWRVPYVLLRIGRVRTFRDLSSALFTWWRYVLWDRIFLGKKNLLGKKWCIWNGCFLHS